MSELRGCPFCGKYLVKRNYIEPSRPWRNCDYYTCDTIRCPMKSVKITYQDMQAWNTRTADATIAKVLEECEREIPESTWTYQDLLEDKLWRIKRIIERGSV